MEDRVAFVLDRRAKPDLEQICLVYITFLLYVLRPNGLPPI